MFILQDETKDTIVKENVSFTRDKVKQDMYVSFKHLGIEEHKQLMIESGKAEKERANLKLMANAKNNDNADVDALIAMIDEKFEEDTEDCDYEILKEAIVDIEGIKDEKKADIPYTDKVLKQILNMQEPRIALMDKFNEIHTADGRKRAKRKN